MTVRPQALLAALLIAGYGLGYAARTTASEAPRGLIRAAADTGFTRLRLASVGNQARYIVNEQLAGRPLRNDAIGSTTAVTGQLVLDRKGKFVADSSALSIDLASLTTDQARRDNFVRQRTLEVAQYPTAVLQPRELRGLSWPLPTAGEHSFQLVGDLTLHGVTRSGVWDVKADFAGNRITGTARTHFRFADYNLEIPRLAFILSVQDSIRLEYDFVFER